jgi:uncharacterized protein (DUF433 family)
MDWRTRISTDPAVCHGKACVKGPISLGALRIVGARVSDSMIIDYGAHELHLRPPMSVSGALID